MKHWNVENNPSTDTSTEYLAEVNRDDTRLYHRL